MIRGGLCHDATLLAAAPMARQIFPMGDDMTRQFLTTTAAAALTAALLAGAAQAENVVTMNTVQIFGTIDPAKISDYTDYMASVNLYDGLATVDGAGNLVPELAESWVVANDASSVTFTIRADATFSDGSPVEAKDVVYSFERLLRINQGPANLFAGVVAPGNVVAVDDKTVTFTLSKTFAPFMTTVPALRILNSDVVADNAGSDDAQEWLANNVAGAGAYLLVSWDRGSRMIIKRNPDYYGAMPENPIDEVRWIITNDEATVRALAASGELTMSSQFQSPDTYQALVNMGRFRLESQPTATGFYLKLNSQLAPTDDVHIRRAIAYAIDYDTIREVIFPGEPMTTVLPSAFADFHAGDVEGPLYDLERAAAEVAQSSYAEQPIPLTLGYVAGTLFEEEISLMMQANLESLGFVIVQQPDPWNRITEIASSVDSTPNVNQIFFGPTYPSPDSMFFTQYHSDASGTWASMEWLQDPEVDALIDAARATGDVAEQAELYKQVQRNLAEQMVSVPLLAQTVQHAMDNCLQGFAAVPMQSFDYDFVRYSWTC
ncbi:MAG: ABC transporter substrate-binding protein [Proteobacteria bacterium]|nr:ABC transporter substrate-binding protein [Pseudomonadota bacterium]MDA1153657.1 ABC transporter substrate-binding protein [Pseudomonadota bacterium]